MENNILKVNQITVEDTEHYTVLKLLHKLIGRINELVYANGDIYDKLDYLLKDGLSEEVVKALTDWLNDGTLSDIITEEVLVDIDSRLDTLEDKTNAQFSLLGHFASQSEIEDIFKNLKSGDTVYIPKGEYTVDVLPIQGVNNVKIYGNGCTLRAKTATQLSIINISNAKNIIIDNVIFSYPTKPAEYANSSYCVKAYDYAYVHITNCKFIDFADIAIHVDEAKDTNGNTGGTTSASLVVEKCLFDNQTTNDSKRASCIYLGANGEYTVINNNEFRRSYGAVKGYGANSIVSFNTVMSSRLQFSINDALLYFNSTNLDDGVNSGKVIIIGNRLNHNESGATGIYCIGDKTRKERRFTIIDNHILGHGSSSGGYCIGLKNADGSLISGNYTEPVATTIRSNILIETSEKVIVTNNTFQHTKGITLSDSTVICENNVLMSPTSSSSTMLDLSNDDSEVIKNIYPFRFSSTGVNGTETSLLLATTEKQSTGVYKITHNLGHTYYTVSANADNVQEPISISIVRTDNDTTFYVYDKDGNLTDTNIMGVITINTNRL